MVFQIHDGGGGLVRRWCAEHGRIEGKRCKACAEQYRLETEACRAYDRETDAVQAWLAARRKKA